jgi:hypothetical protein
MSSPAESARDKIRRSISMEMARQEDDFDETRIQREKIIAKLIADVERVNIASEAGTLDEKTSGVAISLYNTALKALNDKEKANSVAVSLKLKNQEQEILGAAEAKDRIAIVLRATAPGKITESFPSELLESSLTEMFGDDIKDFELKTNPRDIT